MTLQIVRTQTPLDQTERGRLALRYAMDAANQLPTDASGIFDALGLSGAAPDGVGLVDSQIDALLEIMCCDDTGRVLTRLSPQLNMLWRALVLDTPLYWRLCASMGKPFLHRNVVDLGNERFIPFKMHASQATHLLSVREKSVLVAELIERVNGDLRFKQAFEGLQDMALAHGWVYTSWPSLAALVVDETLKYLHARAFARLPLSPCVLVDCVWHIMAGDATKFYRRFCSERLGGYFVHHYPSMNPAGVGVKNPDLLVGIVDELDANRYAPARLVWMSGDAGCCFQCGSHYSGT